MLREEGQGNRSCTQRHPGTGARENLTRVLSAEEEEEGRRGPALETHHSSSSPISVAGFHVEEEEEGEKRRRVRPTPTTLPFHVGGGGKKPKWADEGERREEGKTPGERSFRSFVRSPWPEKC